MCQVFTHFSGIVHNFVLAKLATSSLRVQRYDPSVTVLVDSWATATAGHCRFERVFFKTLTLMLLVA